MTHPEIALETTAEERGNVRFEIARAARVDGGSVLVKRETLTGLVNDIDTLLARVADAERAGRIKGLQEALGAVSLVIGFHGEACPSTEAAAAIRSLIPDPETKEDDNG